MASHRSNCSALARVRLASDDPGSPEVRMEAAVADAGVDPEHVALDQLALGREKWAGQIARRGPRPIGHPLGHHLPDRVENVGVCARLEDHPQERRREFGLTDTRFDAGLHACDGPFGDPERLAHAGQLIGRLCCLGLADDAPSIGGSALGEEDRLLAAEGVGPFVHGDDGVGRHQRLELRGEALHSFVEVEVEGTVEVIARQVRGQPIVLPYRREQMRPLVVSQDHRNGLLEVRPTRVGQWPNGAGGVHHVRISQQHERVEALLAHGAMDASHPVTAHAGEVRLRRDQRGRCRHHQSGRHQASTPR